MMMTMTIMGSGGVCDGWEDDYNESGAVPREEVLFSLFFFSLYPTLMLALSWQVHYAGWIPLNNMNRLAAK